MSAAETYIKGEAIGGQGRLFNLIFACSMLTLVTLGVYSFWMRTRVRRWLWSSVKVDGAPMEYTGRPLEKLMGFVFAAVLVAIWLGLVVMVLIWASLNLFQDVTPGVIGAAALLAPIYFWAQYRGIRYLLNHTRWRGLSFWMVPGAWGYAWRAIMWWALTVLTLGLLAPMKARALWRYRVERTRWGSHVFHHDTALGGLYRVFVPLAASYLVNGLIIAMATITENEAHLAWLILTVPFSIFAWVWWRVRSYGLLVSGISLETGPRLTVAPRVGRVIGIHFLGYLALSLALSAIVPVFFAIGGLAALGVDWQNIDQPGDLPIGTFAVVFVAGYVTWTILRGALRIVFTTFPLIRHVTETLRVSDAPMLARTGPGQGERMADADGFANLFDTGIGI